MDDRELLREYVERQSEPAFAELVARHVDFVYATAARVVGDSPAAQDVAQAVFIHLARKAWTVRDGNALVGWLYRATYRTALDAVRGEQRRRERETEAMNLAETNAGSPAAWEKLAPLLDETMQQLNRVEQNALLLRYFDGKSLRETGAALGTSEAAAQMRVSRALEKMRTHFARNGVTVATGALAVALSANTAKAAPADLATRVIGTSLAGATGTGGLLGRILFMSTKSKIALAAVALLVVVAGLKFTIWQSAEPSVPVTTTASLPPSNPPQAPILPTSKPMSIQSPASPPAPAKSSASATTVAAAPASLSPLDEGKVAAASIFVTQSMQTPLLSYKLNMGKYPTDLRELIENTSGSPGWEGPYITTDDVPLDPWHNPYQYAYPGLHNPDGYDMWSMGPDGISGTADDVGNWGTPP